MSLEQSLEKIGLITLNSSLIGLFLLYTMPRCLENYSKRNSLRQKLMSIFKSGELKTRPTILNVYKLKESLKDSPHYDSLL